MSERYTELMDAAQQQQDETTRAAIARVQAAARRETHPDFDGKHCVDGGELIPKARRDLGKIRCVECQQALEQTNRRTR